jgi:hypothetical protein
MRTPKMEFTAPLRCKKRPHLRLMRKLVGGQPLLLCRQPSNPHDRNAISVHDLFNAQCGWVGREVAAKIAPLMDLGWCFMAHIIKPHGGVLPSGEPVWPIMNIWLDGKPESGIEVSVDANRIPDHVSCRCFPVDEPDYANEDQWGDQ